MADFLESFDFGASDDYTPDDDGACASVDDLQRRLRGLIDSKTTNTRAEHVYATLDVAGTVEFTVAEAEGVNVTDPQLLGEAMDVDGQQATRTHAYTALEALRNQPSQSPAVQQALAEQIVMAVGVEDKSTWVLQSCELAAHGWDFTFICEASVRHWKMQNKGKTLPVVGDFTKKEPEPVLMGRPAFDCRGQLFISFSRKARAISVRYNHTVLHRTVAEMTDFFKPPPMIGPQKPDKTTLAEAAKLTQVEATKAKRKKAREERRQSEGKPKEGGKRKSKKGTEQTEAQLSLADQASQALDLADVSQLQRAVAVENGVNGESSASQGANSGAGTAGGQLRSAAKALSLNVTPQEAARRKEIALKLLTDAGVNSESLSTDQFTIFANQAPDLQKESLNMLVTYGAERLQIIHPSNKESTTPVPQGNAAATGEPGGSTPRTTTTELGLEDETSKRKRKGPRPLGKSRLACFQCKSRKVKCPKERPSCIDCQNSGNTCEYPPHKPRNRKPMSAAVVADGDDEDADADGDADNEEVDGEADHTVMTEANDDPARQEAPQQTETLHDDDGFSSDTGAPYSYPQVPQIPAAADVPREPADDPIHGFHHQPTELPYFQSASGLALPQPDPLEDPPRNQLDTSMTMPGSSIYYPSYPPPAPDPTREPEERPQRNIPASNHSRYPSGSRNTNTPTQSWTASNNDFSKPPTAHISPLLRHGQPGPPGSASPDPVAPAQINIQDATLLAQGASHNQSYAPNSGMKMHRPAPASQSPFQTAYNSPSKSQQGHRPSSLTPQQTSVYQLPAAQPRLQNPLQRSTLLPTGRFGNSDVSDSGDKIGYKPYSYQKNGSGGGHVYLSHYNSEMGSGGHALLVQGQGHGQGAGRQGQTRTQAQAQGQSHSQGQGQHLQNWQFGGHGGGSGNGNTSGNEGVNGHEQSRYGYNWGVGDSWNQRH